MEQVKVAVPPVLRLIYAQYALMAVTLVPMMVFLVDYVARGLQWGTHSAALFWVVYGLGAIARPMSYGALADRIGVAASTRIALLAQVLAVAALVLSQQPAVLVAAVLVIGSFPPGIVPLTLGRVQQAAVGELGAAAEHLLGRAADGNQPALGLGPGGRDDVLHLAIDHGRHVRGQGLDAVHDGLGCGLGDGEALADEVLAERVDDEGEAADVAELAGRVQQAGPDAQLVEDFGLAHAEVGAKIGRSREYVSNSIRLLQLPEEIQQAVVGKEITEGHARALLMLTDRPQEMETLFKEMVLKKTSVRMVEQMVRRIAQDKIRKHSKSPEMMALEKSLTETLGTRVLIENRPQGGRLLIEFFSNEDLSHIVAALAEKQEISAAPIEVVEAAAAVESEAAAPAETSTAPAPSAPRRKPPPPMWRRRPRGSRMAAYCRC